MEEPRLIVIIGGGGHAKVVADIIYTTGKYKIVGFTDLHPGSPVGDCNIPYLGDDTVLPDLVGRGVLQAAMGVGGFDNRRRQSLYEKIVDRGFQLPSLVHSSASVSPYAVIGEGTVIMPGAVVQAGAHLAANVIVNTGAVVEHDCSIGHSALVASGAILCGGVRVGDRAFVGAGACIIQYKNIGADCTIGAGSVVIDDLGQGQTAVGNPARVLWR